MQFCYEVWKDYLMGSRRAWIVFKKQKQISRFERKYCLGWFKLIVTHFFWKWTLPTAMKCSSHCVNKIPASTIIQKRPYTNPCTIKAETLPFLLNKQHYVKSFTFITRNVELCILYIHTMVCISIHPSWTFSTLFSATNWTWNRYNWD